MSLYHHPTYLLKALAEREQNGILRKLTCTFPEIDFCSNDYLGFSKLGLLDSKIHAQITEQDADGKPMGFGATGSRLVSGNSRIIEETEKQIAFFHHAESALIFNSGYDANVGLLSSVPQKNDLILYDEMIHASIYDGIRLSHSTHYKFAHNDMENLSELIQRHRKDFENIYVVAESVYSLDGDSAPLLELVEICQDFKNIFLIVDEAHGIGVFGKQGRGLCNALSIEKKIFARIYTYGKAMGCHGAAIVGSDILRNYLINFSRTFIYTTALPYYSIEAIKHSYQLLIETNQKDLLQNNIAYFYTKAASIKSIVKSQSGIHAIQLGSNDLVDKLDRELKSINVHARIMKSPMIKQGKERIRFSIHAFNTKAEIDSLIDCLSRFSK
ncbi:aminotransferase class I/II-fold pyridoxal phosphate-dependent enzyme [Aurantibacillus circumpalustris]|uniref:aminotransferase class I/II-fold pyridoxal phosphate-dependent enzyme n=1 Tax=Aurantibacillus circumpalustris TaxID=3036359 RepID=UPI00295B8666|nr:aminotransferase class I/II-fold pyridoxal phosphate-dependent enzyme [Aurantibacillus circumpalustris]